MRYRIFGRRTGLRVSELALGGSNFGERLRPGAALEESKSIFEAYVAAGGNFIDTGDYYQLGESEEILGTLIAGRRDDLVIGTKYTYGSNILSGPTAIGNSRKSMMRAVEGSLKRLNTDRIDIYWCHLSDNVTPMDEILRGMDDLVRAGKVLYVGLSNFPAWRTARGALMADLQGWAPLTAIQVEYNLIERSPDRELLHMCEALGLAAALWGPLAGGLLSGKHRAGAVQGASMALRAISRSEATARDTAIIDALFAVGEETGRTPAEVCIAWLRSRAARSTTALIPILGPRTRAQLDSVLGGLAFDLTADQADRLDAVSALSLGVPRESGEHQRTRDMVFGGDAARFELPASPAA